MAPAVVVVRQPDAPGQVDVVLHPLDYLLREVVVFWPSYFVPEFRRDRDAVVIFETESEVVE